MSVRGLLDNLLTPRPNVRRIAPPTSLSPIGKLVGKSLEEMEIARYSAKVSDALDDLGATSEAVAITLLRARVLGKQKSPTCCPVSVLLTQTLVPWAYVTPKKVQFQTGRGFYGSIRTPRIVQDFLLRFDRGVYGKLVQIEEGKTVR